MYAASGCVANGPCSTGAPSRLTGNYRPTWLDSDVTQVRLTWEFNMKGTLARFNDPGMNASMIAIFEVLIDAQDGRVLYAHVDTENAAHGIASAVERMQVEDCYIAYCNHFATGEGAIVLLAIGSSAEHADAIFKRSTPKHFHKVMVVTFFGSATVSPCLRSASEDDADAFFSFLGYLLAALR